MPRTSSTVLSQEELRRLAEQQTAPAISIYFPTVRANVDTHENSLHLKSLFSRVTGSLESSDLRPKQIDELVEPIQELLDEGEFWMHQLDGLAIFRTPELFRVYKLPFPVAEDAVVGKHLKLSPLVRRLPGSDRWHLLCFSKGEVRLLDCTIGNVERVDLSEVEFPRSLAEALKYDDLSKPEGMHHEMVGPGARMPASGGGSRDRAFPGHGEHGDEEKTQIWRYARLVDEGIAGLLRDGDPLMLACVDYLAPIYKEASHYNDVLDEIVEGNPDGLRDDELHERARPIIERRADDRLSGLLERVGTGLAHDRATTDMPSILEAAEQGRIDTLFVERDARRWGRWDPTGGGLTERSEPKSGDDDLIELATHKTLLTSGTVLALDRDRMPGNASAVALFRY